MRLSAIVISYNMTRELPRTVRSLSPAMQRGVAPDDYELIVIDNGSTAPVDEAACRRWAPNMTLHRMESPGPSPVKAINKGLEMARGEVAGVFIDGARMASPGMLAKAIEASELFERPAIGTIAFHLGPRVQMESVSLGYGEEAEDALLQSCGWEEDGYGLFDVAVFAWSSSKGWFAIPAETNALFLKTEHWREIGGYDENFVTPGGGLVNLDVWARLCADPRFSIAMLLGEATFHQVHGGIATNSPNPPHDEFYAEYRRLRGHAYAPPNRAPVLFGAPPPQAMRWIAHSAALAQGRVLPNVTLPNLTNGET